MASSGSFDSNLYDGERGINFSWSLASQSIAGNYSVINWSVTGCGGGSYSYYMAGAFTATINGNTVLSSGSRIQLYNGTGVGSGSFTIGHNADGTGSFSAYAEAGVYTYAVSVSGSGSWSLPTIPRTSNVTLNKSSCTLNGSDGFVIYTNRASSSFSHNLYQNISGSWAQIASGVGDNYTWIPSTNFYENVGNGSGTYQILCQTWSGGTHIGDSQVNFTLASAGVHQCSLNTGSITLNGSNGVRIYTNRNSGSFMHHIEQNFSGSMAELCSGYSVTDYLDWTPPVDWYNTIGEGSKSFTIRVHCANNSGKYLGYTDVGFTIYSAGADSVSLNNTNMTMGTDYTVSIAKRVSSFSHTITWAFGSASGTLGTTKAVDTSVGWTPSTDLSAQILTAMTGQGTVTCQTYYGDTSIGSTSVAFNLSVPSYNVVLGTPAITETGKDNTGTALTDKGVGATEVVAIMSIKRLVVSATTSYNATIKTISVSFGGSTKTVSSGSFDDTFSGMMNGNLTITATDSRGRALASTYSQSYTFQDYFKPSVTSFDGDRASQTGDTGTLNAAGTFWNKTAGTTANVLTGAISISATGATTIVPTENKWTTAFDVSGVTYQNSYNFKIVVTDSFGFTAEKTYTLNASVPVLVKLKHTVRIYRNLVVSNIIKATKGYFTGDLKVGGKIDASGNVTAPTFVGSLSGNATSATNATNATHATTADFLSGFISKSSNQGWGQQAGSFVTGFDATNGSDIAFRRDCPVTGQLSVIIDGRFYQNEGQYRCLDTSDILNSIYPVGSIYISNSSTSPASLFGGTWTQIAQGRTLIGQGTGYDVNATGGSETVSLTAEQNGPHDHSINEQYLHGGVNGDFANSHDGGSLNGWDYTPSGTNQGVRRMTIPATSTNSSGSGSAHNNMMPYLVKYMWERTA